MFVLVTAKYMCNLHVFSTNQKGRYKENPCTINFLKDVQNGVQIFSDSLKDEIYFKLKWRLQLKWQNPVCIFLSNEIFDQLVSLGFFCISSLFNYIKLSCRGRPGRDRMVIGFTTTHLHMQSVPITTKVVSLNPADEVFSMQLCDKVCQWLAAGRWFSMGTPVSSTNGTVHHSIAEILLKVHLNIITIALYLYFENKMWYLIMYSGENNPGLSPISNYLN